MEHQKADIALGVSGFCVWPKLIPHELIDAHLSAFAKFEAGGQPATQVHTGITAGSKQVLEIAAPEKRLFHRTCEDTLRLCFSDTLAQFLRDYWSCMPVLSYAATGHYSLEAPLHNDTLFFRSIPNRDQIRVWCALEDVPFDAGPVYFYEKSHSEIAPFVERRILERCLDISEKLWSEGRCISHEFWIELTAIISRQSKVVVESLIDERQPERRTPLLKKGDAILFRPDTFHGSTRHTSNLTRTFLIMDFFKADASFYHGRAYFGPTHDFRGLAGSVQIPIEMNSFGAMIRPPFNLVNVIIAEQVNSR